VTARHAASGLRLNPHLHLLVPEGLFGACADPVPRVKYGKKGE